MYDLALRALGHDPFLNLALEESFLERGSRDSDAVILLYINDPCVVVGRNQNPWIEVAPRTEAPVLRRVSGGGAVYHDRGNLNWSLIVPRASHDKDEELGRVSRALRGLGVEAGPGPRGGLFLTGEGPWNGQKISGTARRLSSSRVLHHGTLLVEADLSRLASTLGGGIKPESSRALPSVRSTSVNLASVVPGLRVEEAARAIAREFSSSELAAAESFADMRYAGEAASRLGSWEWTWGSTPSFLLALDWSGGRAVLEVIKGMVASASGAGAESLSGIAGRRFGYTLPEEAIEVLEGRDASSI